MANLYVDLLSGNDSSNATSFANRVKTINGGITAARTAPGDVIRIMKTSDPVNMGVDATFTNKSDTVTLASALTANIDLCETAWSVNTNVTSTTSTTARQGANAVSISVAAAFTTGVAAYKDLGASTDFSAYNGISFWINGTAGNIAANALRIDLCSDAFGTTVLQSFTLNRSITATSGQWYPFTIAAGTSLPNNVRSVALFVVTDLSTTSTITFRLDNILAVNADYNGLNLNSVISLSSSATALDFYAIKSINGTTIKLDGQAGLTSVSTERGYYGTTTTSRLYLVNPILVTAGSTMTPNEAGSALSRSLYSGGWNATDMSTQTGLTFIDAGFTSNTTTVSLAAMNASSYSYLDFENIVFVRGGPGLSVGVYSVIRNCASIMNYTGLHAVSGGTEIYSCFALQCNTGINVSSTGTYVIKNSTASCCATNGILLATNSSSALYSCNTHNNNSFGLGVQNSASARIWQCDSKDNLTYGYSFNSHAVYLYGCTSSNNLTGGLNCTGGNTYATNCTFNEATKIASSGDGCRVVDTCRSGNPAQVFIQDSAASTTTIDIVTTPVHGSATKSWRHLPGNSTFPWTSDRPMTQYLSPIAVAATGTFTFKIWVQRQSTTTSARVMIRGGQCPGVSSDISASASASANTWEELTLTASPTAAATLTVELHTWGAGLFVYWGDATVSQT